MSIAYRRERGRDESRRKMRAKGEAGPPRQRAVEGRSTLQGTAARGRENTVRGTMANLISQDLV